MAGQEIQVEGRRHDPLVVAAQLGDQVAAMVGDEGGAVEPLAAAGIVFPGLEASAIGAHHRDHVGDRVALHGAAPRQGGVQVGIVRLGADGGGVEQHLGAHQGHGPGGFRIPLVPADADAQATEAAVPDLEAGVAGAEIVLLHIARPVGDVAFAVEAHERAVRVHHHQGIEIVRPLALEDRDRQHHPQLGGQGRQGGDAGMLPPGVSLGKPALLLGHAEIGALEQFRGQDHLGAAGRGLADQALGLLDVRRPVQAVGGLQGGDGDLAGHQAGSCWVMQWNEPPPDRMAFEGRPITSRSGNRAARPCRARFAANPFPDVGPSP